MGSRRSQLIVADDDRTIRQLLEFHGKKAGFEVLAVADGEEAMKLVSEQTEVILLDLNMPGKDGFECLDDLAKAQLKLPAIVLTADQDIQDAVKAMKLGAFDYITKPFDPDELIAVLLNAKRLSLAQRENEDLREEIGGPRAEVFMIAECDEMKDIARKAAKVAKIDSTVLITGESGVGKGVLARYLHSLSGRSSQPFVTVSCPTLPRELLESELFGHEKGAFTGAVKRRIGKIEAAQGGTLFLDEIGDLPLDLQPKFLNFLQDQEFQRVGGESTLQADVRVIAASNVDFEQQVKDGNFRQDLYYRLSVIPFELPPLRERVDELPALCEALLQKVAKRQQKAVSLSAEAAEMLLSYDWPGNVRQLENVLERASAFCEEGVIQVEDLPREVRQESQGEDLALAGLGGITLAQLEVQAIKQTLSLCKGNKAKTARQLGITEKSVYNKMKRHGLS